MPNDMSNGPSPSSARLEGVACYRVLDLHINHISPEDSGRLRLGLSLMVDEHDIDQHVYHYMPLPIGYAQPIPEGWMLRIFEEWDPTDRTEFLALGFSEAFADLLQLCAEQRYAYVRLDLHGDRAPGLPRFDWGSEETT